MKNKLILLLVLLALPASAEAASNKQGNSSSDVARRQSEVQIRNLLEPLLDKYCRDECKLMGVNVDIDVDVRNEVAPGFDDIDPNSVSSLAPSSGRVKLLIDEKVGPVSRGKLLELIQQFLDNLDYPVKVDTQIARFPQPVGSASKIAELREKLTRQFKTTIDDLFHQFCPDQCLLADYDLQTEVVNAEESQYGSQGEFVEDGGVALRVKSVNGTILVDETLNAEAQRNILEMAKLKTNYLKNVNLNSRSMKFPRPTNFGSDLSASNVDGKAGRGLASADSKESKESNESKLNSNSNTDTKNSSSTQSQSAENNTRQERFERIEKIERVESGDAVQAELQKFKVYGLVFACAVLALLVFVAIATMSPRSSKDSGGIQRIISSITSDPTSGTGTAVTSAGDSSRDEKLKLVAMRYEIERLVEELMSVFAQNPKVAKHVFTRVLTEEGIETTAQYIHIFGESVVMDMLRDPSLQSDLSELMEFYAKNPQELTDDEKLQLVRALHSRTVAGKLVVMGSRSSHLFDFLAEMDGLQILELIRNESLTVKSIVLTQCDPQKRSQIYSQVDDKVRMDLMGELSRIDYLPRDYIFNVANALKRKRRENPKLNTEALPGSEVLLTLLERSDADQARTVIKNLEITNPDSARALKSKLVSIDTLRHLRDGQLLEVILSLRHDELLQFLKGAAEEVRMAIFSKSPKDLVLELEEELQSVGAISREQYQGLERKILNRMKLMANEGLINLVETNERMLTEDRGQMGTGVSRAAS